MSSPQPTGDVRVRVIAQHTERLWAELVLHDFRPDVAVDIEVLYPDGRTVRYSRGID